MNRLSAATPKFPPSTVCHICTSILEQKIPSGLRSPLGIAAVQLTAVASSDRWMTSCFGAAVESPMALLGSQNYAQTDDKRSSASCLPLISPLRLLAEWTPQRCSFSSKDSDRLEDAAVFRFPPSNRFERTDSYFRTLHCEN